MTPTTATISQKGFRVKVSGTYFARSPVGEKSIVKPYEFEATIPSLNSALSTVKNKLLTPFLSRMFEDYKMFRTYHIIQITPLDEKSKQQMNKVEIQYMDRSALVSYIRDNALPVDSRLYPDLFNLRVAVQDAKNDPEGYLKKLKSVRDSLELDVQLAQMNPELQANPNETPGVSVANTSDVEVSSTQTMEPAKQKLTKANLEKQTESRVDGLRHDMIQTNEHGDTNDPMDI